MIENGEQINVLGDLFETIFSVLSRTAVQRQLLVFVVALIIGSVVAIFLNRWLRRQMLASISKRRWRWVRTRFLRRLVWRLVEQLAAPLLVGALLLGAIPFFQNFGWLYGLITRFLELTGAVAFYRVGIIVLYFFFDDKDVRTYRSRLLSPLFGIIIFLLAINLFVNLRTLGNVTLFTNESTTITIGSIFAVTVGAYFWVYLTISLQELAQFAVARFTRSDVGVTQASLLLWRYGMLALGLFLGLNILGIDTTTVAAISGGLSIGVGFALQDVLRNFLGGVILMFEGSVRPKDVLEYEGQMVTVESLRVRSTVVRTLDNVEMVIPNQDLLSTPFTTFTRNNRRIRLNIPVGVSYSSDISLVMDVLNEVIKDLPHVLEEPPAQIELDGFGDSSVDMLVRVWIDDAIATNDVSDEIRLRIWHAFLEHDIEIPFPQRDLHIRSGLPAQRASE